MSIRKKKNESHSIRTLIRFLFISRNNFFVFSFFFNWPVLDLLFIFFRQSSEIRATTAFTCPLSSYSFFFFFLLFSFFSVWRSLSFGERRAPLPDQFASFFLVPCPCSWLVDSFRSSPVRHLNRARFFQLNRLCHAFGCEPGFDQPIPTPLDTLTRQITCSHHRTGHLPDRLHLPAAAFLLYRYRFFTLQMTFIRPFSFLSLPPPTSR